MHLVYIGVHSEKLEDWQDFSCKLLGMQNVDRGKKNIKFLEWIIKNKG